MPATIKELRLNRTFAPGGVDSNQLLHAYLPLVYGSASVLIPDDSGSQSAVVVAVFRTFSSRWRRTPRRTVLATWFLRTTWFVANRQRRLLKLPPPVNSSPTALYLALFRKFNRLHRKWADPIALCTVMGLPAVDAARVLRTNEAHLSKHIARGTAKLEKPLRPFLTEANFNALLKAIPSPVPREVEDVIEASVNEPPPKRIKDPLVLAGISAWRRIRLRRFLRRSFATAGIAFCCFILFAGSVAWLASRGYLTVWFIKLSNQHLVKEFPDLAKPARPWPTVAGQTSLPAQAPPKTAADLYVLTNIWTARLSFTADAWRHIQPGHVKPISMSQPDGHLSLRNPNAHRNGLAGVIGIDFNWAEARLTFAGVEFPKVAARYRGNGTFVNSLFGPKQSFKVDLNKFNEAETFAGVHTLNFVNSIPDNSYLHDALGERLFRDLGVPAPRTTFAYLTVDATGSLPDRPLGLYVLIENIDAEFALDRFGSKKVPIFKPVTTDLFKDLGDDWTAYKGIYDLKTKASPEQLKRVIEFARLVTSASDAEFSRRLPDFLNLEEFAGFLAGHVLLSSYDGFLSNGQNFYMYLDPASNRFGFIPWDHDHGWGEFGYVATAPQREKASIWQPSTYANRFLERVLKVEAFRTIYRQVLERAMANLFIPNRLYAQIDEVAAVIRPAVAAESDFRLHRFDQAVSTNWLSGSRDGAPEGPKAPVHQMKRFIVNRVKSVQDQLSGVDKGVVLHQR